jgi:hypothetical protein
LALSTRDRFRLEAFRALVPSSVSSPSDAVPDDYEPWLRHFFPRFVRHPFAPHHAEFWGWAWAIARGVRPRPHVEILPRGGAKSTSAELAVAAWGCRRTRRYAWYVSETQEQADDHVGTIATMLESDEVARAYPPISERRLGKFGNQRGWRRNRLWTADGFVVDALGLDSASRGIKLEEVRPDAMIFDDLDRQSDGPEIVDKKISTLTRSILPAGTDDLAVLAIQNLVHSDGIFARMAGVSDHAVDFLADRTVSGPHPALLDAAYEERDGRWYVVAGTPTWAGQDLEACQRMIATYGLSAFKIECQHEVDLFVHGLWADVAFLHCRPDEVPDLVRTTVWVDPAVSETDTSDSHGIQADGIAADAHKTIYRLYSWEGVTSPLEAIRHAITVARRLRARTVGIETDQGGSAWKSVYREACRSLVEDGTVPDGTRFPSFRAEKAGRGYGPKVERASKQLADYERGRIVHVLDADRSYATLERALKRFPVRKPFDLVDASFWAWADLRGKLLDGVLAAAMEPEAPHHVGKPTLDGAVVNRVGREWAVEPPPSPAARRRLGMLGREGRAWPGGEP